MQYVKYHIAGKFGKFGESSIIRQTKTIQISTYNYNLCLNLFIRQTFYCQMLKTSKFVKLYPCQNFLLYGMS